MKFSRAWRCFAAVVMMAVACSNAASSPESDPTAQILQDWAKRRQELGFVRYVFSGVRTWWPPADASGATNQIPNQSVSMPQQEVSGKVSVSATFDFVNNRFRIEQEREELGVRPHLLHRFNVISVSSGGVYKSQILPGSSLVTEFKADFIIQKGDPVLLSTGTLEFDYWKPILFSAGVVPSRTQWITSARFAPTNDSGAFKFERFSSEGGERYAVLVVGSSTTRLQNQTHYWVDLRRDSAIVKAVTTMSRGEQQLKRRIWSIDYSLSGKHWLAHHWTISDEVRGVPVSKGVFAISTAAALTNVDNSVFELEPAPGMNVGEEDLSYEAKTIVADSKRYKVETSSRTGSASVAREIKKIETDKSIPPVRQPWLVIILLLVTSAVFAFWAFRPVPGKRNR